MKPLIFLILTCLGLLLLSGCVYPVKSESEHGYMIYTAPKRHTGDLKSGVVIGIWKYDESENLRRLNRIRPKLDRELLQSLNHRYQVKIVSLQSNNSLRGSEIALLPESWVYITDQIGDSLSEINIGDVVETRVIPDTNIDQILRIKRKCNQKAAANEPGEWNLGCFRVPRFSKPGYAGFSFNHMRTLWRQEKYGSGQN